MPILPVAAPRSRMICAITLYGLSSSCQTRTSFENLINSRARASSNPGVTHASSPLAGITTPNVSLAVPPAHAGEVEHARAALEEHRADAVLGHEPPRLLDARAALVVGDGDDGRRLLLEGGDARAGARYRRAMDQRAATPAMVAECLRKTRRFIGVWSGRVTPTSDGSGAEHARPPRLPGPHRPRTWRLVSTPVMLQADAPPETHVIRPSSRRTRLDGRVARRTVAAADDLPRRAEHATSRRRRAESRRQARCSTRSALPIGIRRAASRTSTSSRSTADCRALGSSRSRRTRTRRIRSGRTTAASSSSSPIATRRALRRLARRRRRTWWWRRRWRPQSALRHAPRRRRSEARHRRARRRLELPRSRRTARHRLLVGSQRRRADLRARRSPTSGRATFRARRSGRGTRRAWTTGSSRPTARASTSSRPTAIDRDERARNDKQFTVQVRAIRRRRSRASGSFDVATKQERKARRATRRTASPTSRISPDGKWIGYHGMSASRYERGNLEQNDYADLYLLEVATRQDRAPDEERHHRRRRRELLARQQVRRVLGAGRFQVPASRRRSTCAPSTSPSEPWKKLGGKFDYRRARRRRPRRRRRRRDRFLVGEGRHDLLQHRHPRDDAVLRVSMSRTDEVEAAHRSQGRRRPSVATPRAGASSSRTPIRKTPPAHVHRRRRCATSTTSRSGRSSPIRTRGSRATSRSATRKRSRGSRPTADGRAACS